MVHEENVKEPYRWVDDNTPGRLDINGVEWWACDPYPTWYRYDDGELKLDHAEWMPEDRSMAIRNAQIKLDRVEQYYNKVLEQLRIAQALGQESP